MFSLLFVCVCVCLFFASFFIIDPDYCYNSHLKLQLWFEHYLLYFSLACFFFWMESVSCGVASHSMIIYCIDYHVAVGWLFGYSPVLAKTKQKNHYLVLAILQNSSIFAPKSTNNKFIRNHTNKKKRKNHSQQFQQHLSFC